MPHTHTPPGNPLSTPTFPHFLHPLFPTFLHFPHNTQATETFFAKCQVSVVVDVAEIIFWSLLHEGVRVSKYLPPRYMYIYNGSSYSKSNSMSCVMLPGA